MFTSICKKVMLLTLKPDLTLKSATVHLWRMSLLLQAETKAPYLALLSADEAARAERFHFRIHRERFIAARAMLRLILGLYLQKLPESLQFSYSEKGKPSLPDSDIQFNISHSETAAVLAVTLHDPIGVDIEKREDFFKDSLAKRYFSSAEYASLLALPEASRSKGFYAIWSRKEALLKATGEGLHTPLDSFTVALDGTPNWHLQSFLTFPEYEAAFATLSDVKTLVFYEFDASGARVISA
jgi:4'-phosphopantetheinyl transferase